MTPSPQRGLSLDRLKSFEQLVSLALDYSGNAPLHISLCYGQLLLDSACDAVWVSTVKSFARHSHRWRYVTLDLPDALLSEMSAFVWDLPLLESLTAYRRPLPFDMVNIAPKLRRLEVRRCDPPSSLKLPWCQILELQLELCSNTLPYIQLCTNLQTLHFRPFSSEDEDLVAEEQIGSVIVDIQSLLLTDLYYSEDLEQVFNVFTFPRLAQFSLSVSSYFEWSWSETHTRLAESFLKRSACTITSLKMDSIPIPDDHLISLLRLLPTIKELYIEQSCNFTHEDDEFTVNITDPFIDSLCISPSQLLLPELRAIEMRIEHEHAPSCEALIDFVQSRWLLDSNDSGVNRLESVIFRFLYGTIDYDFTPLAYLRDVGLNFTVTGVQDL